MNLPDGKNIIYVWDDLIAPTLQTVLVLSASYLLISIAKFFDRF